MCKNTSFWHFLITQHDLQDYWFFKRTTVTCLALPGFPPHYATPEHLNLAGGGRSPQSFSTSSSWMKSNRAKRSTDLCFTRGRLEPQRCLFQKIEEDEGPIWSWYLCARVGGEGRGCPITLTQRADLVPGSRYIKYSRKQKCVSWHINKANTIKKAQVISVESF